jgi:ketosteroid isomerase-like protein
MAKFKYFVLPAAAALVFPVCARIALANDANAATTADKGTPSGPAEAALVALETSAYEAWKSKDAKFWDTFLSDRFVGWGSFGRLDKSSAKKEYTGADCEIKNYVLSDERTSPRGKDAALITYKVTVDGTCGGQKIPANSWAASVYVRDGDRWKGVFHAKDSIVNPNEAPAKPTGKMEARKGSDAHPTDQDTRTDAMLAVEKAVWEAWRMHDAKKLAELTARDISFINIFGTYLPNKADALKNWSGAGCDVTSVGLTDAAGTMLSPTVGILTFKATADGTCYGQRVGPVWGSSIYIKDGNAWKWTFGINVPGRAQGT